MRGGRRFLLYAGRVLVAAVVAPGTAAAQVEVSSESGPHCNAIQVTGPHAAIGGCRVEFQSTGEVPLYADVPGMGVVELSNCEMHLDTRIGEDGAGYVTRALLTGHPEPSTPCTRAPCDEAATSHQELLWPISFEEEPGELSVEVVVCLRPSALAEGSTGTFCTLHLPVTELGSHDYEIGQAGSFHSHCEPGLPFDVWFQNAHFTYEDGTDTVEIVH